jgi:hypothetical protein
MFLILAAVLTFRPMDVGLPKQGMWRHGFAVADMNRDDRPDLVLTSPRKNPGPPVIFLNEGNGRWRRWGEAVFPALAFDYGAVAAADFDGNGAMDLAVGSHYHGVIVLLGDGSGTFTAVTDGFAFPASPREAAAFSSRAITVTDWNTDGLIDVAALSDGPRQNAQLGVTVYENRGSVWAAVRAPVTEKDSIFGDSIAAGDVDGDDLPDLVTASHVASDRRILRLGADGALMRREIPTSLQPAFVRAVDVADFDNDGDDEIVAGYVTRESLPSLEVVSFPAGSQPAQLLWSGEQAAVAAVGTGDLDGDGAIDLVAVSDDGHVITFRGDGRGAVTRDATIDTPAWRLGCTPYGLRVRDVDGDNRAEIIAVFAGEDGGCPTGGGIEVWSTTVPPEVNRRRAVRR